MSYVTKTGYSIIITLLIDIFLSAYVPLILDLTNIKSKYILKNNLGKELLRSIKTDKCKYKFFTILSLLFAIPLRTLPNLPALWHPFTTRIFDEKVDNLDYYHYPIKFFTSLIMIGIIISN